MFDVDVKVYVRLWHRISQMDRPIWMFFFSFWKPVSFWWFLAMFCFLILANLVLFGKHENR